MSRIVNFGSLNLDYVYAVDHFVAAGETLSSDSLSVNCGGKGLNQSIAAARAGGSVCHAGVIGRDGGMLTDLLAENGVDVRLVRQSKGPNGHAIIQVDRTGQNCILLFPGSNREADAADVARCLADFGAGDYLILQNETSQVDEAIRAGAARGMTVVFNPSPITPELADYPLKLVSLLILNEVEGAALTGETQPTRILDGLRARFPATRVLLTLGGDGAVYRDENGTVCHGIYRAPTVDTTAAGDTVTGFFVAGLAAGMSPADSLERACKAAAITVSRAGAARSIPTAEEAATCPFPYQPPENE